MRAHAQTGAHTAPSRVHPPLSVARQISGNLCVLQEAPAHRHVEARDPRPSTRSIIVDRVRRTCAPEGTVRKLACR